MSIRNIFTYVILLSCFVLLDIHAATATRYNTYNNNYYHQQQMMRQQQMQQQQMRQQQEQMRRQQEQMRRQQEQMRQQQLRQQQQMRQRQQEMQRQMQARQQQAQLQRKQMQQRQQKMQQQRQKKIKQGNEQAKRQNLAKQQQAAQQRQALKQQKQLRERQQRLKKLRQDRLSKQNADKKKRDAQALTMASLMTSQRTKLMSSTSLSSGVVRQGQNLALNSKERSQLSSQIKERLDAARNNAKRLSLNKKPAKVKDQKPKKTRLAAQRNFGCKNGVCGAKNCSFHGETLVKTKQGFKKISEIEQGNDLVWAKNEFTGESGWKAVVNHYSNKYSEIIEISVTNHEAQNKAVIQSNAIHPFYVPEENLDGLAKDAEQSLPPGNWVEAANLQKGQLLLNADGSTSIIADVKRHDEKLLAYNITVQDFHTYFVKGIGAHNTAVWVHNECASDFEKRLSRIGNERERVAEVRKKWLEVANNQNWTKDKKLSKQTNRDVYFNGKNRYYAIDTQHGRAEIWDKRRKNHLGEMNIDLKRLEGSKRKDRTF